MGVSVSSRRLQLGKPAATLLYIALLVASLPSSHSTQRSTVSGRRGSLQTEYPLLEERKQEMTDKLGPVVFNGLWKAAEADEQRILSAQYATVGMSRCHQKSLIGQHDIENRVRGWKRLRHGNAFLSLLEREADGFVLAMLQGWESFSFVYFVRHSESVNEARVRVMSNTDPTLSEWGELEAKKFGKYMAEAFMARRLEFDWIVSSPLTRAIHFLQLASTTNPYFATSPLSVQTDLTEAVEGSSDRPWTNEQFTWKSRFFAADPDAPETLSGARQQVILGKNVKVGRRSKTITDPMAKLILAHVAWGANPKWERNKASKFLFKKLGWNLRPLRAEKTSALMERMGRFFKRVLDSKTANRVLAITHPRFLRRTLELKLRPGEIAGLAIGERDERLYWANLNTIPVFSAMQPDQLQLYRAKELPFPRQVDTTGFPDSFSVVYSTQKMKALLTGEHQGLATEVAFEQSRLRENANGTGSGNLFSRMGRSMRAGANRLRKSFGRSTGSGSRAQDN